MSIKSALEELFAVQVRALKLPEPVREHRFCKRMWRFDFAWVEQKIAVEVEGGTWTNGRHSRGTGIAADMEKYNHAAILGWRVLRFNNHMVKKGVAVDMVNSLFANSK